MDFTNLDFAKERPDASREDKIRILELYYLRYLVEDRSRKPTEIWFEQLTT